MTEPTLAELIRLARLHQITPAEHEAQVKSFAYGNVHLSNPDITREMIEQAWKDLTSAKP